MAPIVIGVLVGVGLINIACGWWYATRSTQPHPTEEIEMGLLAPSYNDDLNFD